METVMLLECRDASMFFVTLMKLPDQGLGVAHRSSSAAKHRPVLSLTASYVHRLLITLINIQHHGRAGENPIVSPRNARNPLIP